MYKNIFLICLSFIFSLIFIEILLKNLGRYNELTKNNLNPSPAIYERAHSSKQRHKHPDLDYIIENNFDSSGVKNFDTVDTSNKRNIIAFFGDSFVENIAVEKEFEFSYLLDQHIKSYNIVNYGVGGYSADQVFIRYLKYQNHDIKHVFFLLMPGDQGFSTMSEFNEDGTYLIDNPKFNIFYNFLGKLNITYFFIDIYYFVKNKIYINFTDVSIENYNSVLANKIYKKFYHPDLKKCNDYFKSKNDFLNDKCAKDLINLLNIFRDKVNNNGAKFYILLYPNLKHIDYFNRIISDKKNDFKFYILNENLQTGSYFNNTKTNFKNDAHWNEYGNLIFANDLNKILNEIGIVENQLPFNNIFHNINKFYELN